MAEEDKTPQQGREGEETEAARHPSDAKTEGMPPRPEEAIAAGLKPPGRSPARGTPEAEPYRLGAILGEGGMAIVYEAHDPALDRAVAVKVLKPDLAGDPELQSRFLYEARILGQMEHPGVIPVFAAGSLEHHGAYYAMKKVRGRTLRDILKPLGPREVQRSQEAGSLVEVFEKVCQTIAYAHSQGILHRDVKPENIMVDEFGVVVVLDWGLSKKITEGPEEQGILATQAGLVKGTPAYMSPEQASGNAQEIDFRTDVFALGIILYEILTGALPFSGHSRTQVLQEILHREPAPPRRLNRRASRTLSAICIKALSKDPDQRYPSALELAEDVRLYRDRLPTSAYRPGPVERLGNWIGRHTSASAAIGTALALLLVFGGLALHRREAYRIRKAEEQDRERLVEELAEHRDREKVQKSLLTIRTASATLRDFDEKILDLEGRRQTLPPADAAQRADLGRQIDEFQTARYMLSNRVLAIAVSLITELRMKKGGDFDQLDPEVLKFFRVLAVENVRGLVKRQDYYKADYYLWDYLRSGRESPIPWTDAQLEELRDLKQQVERKLREGGAPLPDWEKYRERMPSRKRD